MLKVEAKTVGAYGSLAYSKSLAKSLTFVDRFGLKYELFRKVGYGIWVPRNIVTDSDYIDFDEGWKIAVEDNFVPRGVDQSRVIRECHVLLDSGEDFILQAATGYGKTYIGAELISYLKTRTLIITTKEDIIDQWRIAIVKTCGLHDEQIGVWRGDQIPTDKHSVVIGLVHSIMKGPDRYPAECFKGFGMTIVDEVHRMGADKFNDAMWWVGSWNRVGLSATPYRKDGRENAFHMHIGKVRVRAEQDALLPKIIIKDTGWKVPRVFWYGAYQKQPHEFGKTMGVEVKMAKDKKRNRLITSFCKTAAIKGRNTIVFSSVMVHLANLYADLIALGVPDAQIGWYVGLTNYDPKQGSRKWQREQAKVKPIILATYQMAAEATDIPWLDCCVLGTPRSDVIQAVGRIRREWEDKKQPVVFDLVDHDSIVFQAYWQKRKRWYQEIGAPIIVK